MEIRRRVDLLDSQFYSPSFWRCSCISQGKSTTLGTNRSAVSFARSSCLFSLISLCTLNSISRIWRREKGCCEPLHILLRDALNIPSLPRDEVGPPWAWHSDSPTPKAEFENHWPKKVRFTSLKKTVQDSPNIWMCTSWQFLCTVRLVEDIFRQTFEIT